MILKSRRGFDWLDFAALFTWAVVGIFVALLPVNQWQNRIVAVLVYALLGLTIFFTTTGARRRSNQPLQSWGLILLQYGCALALAYVLQGLPGNQCLYILLVLIAGQAPWRLPFAGAACLALLATVLFALLLGGRPHGFNGSEALGYFTFEVFALLMSRYAVMERRGREALVQANAELEATRTLLSETARQGERLRIARDLHDLIGHHLTALNLDLELASHLTEGRAREAVDQSRSLAKLLLADVREVVRDMREDAGIDLRQALERLLQSTSQLRTEMAIEPTLRFDHPATAETLLRVVQEALTNTLKHASARYFRLQLQPEGRRWLVLMLEDDGRGLQSTPPGYGIRGMQERVASLGGTLTMEDGPAGGCRLLARLPMAEAP